MIVFYQEIACLSIGNGGDALFSEACDMVWAKRLWSNAAGTRLGSLRLLLLQFNSPASFSTASKTLFRPEYVEAARPKVMDTCPAMAAICGM